jgi:hypothetical protein
LRERLRAAVAELRVLGDRRILLQRAADSCRTIPRSTAPTVSFSIAM